MGKRCVKAVADGLLKPDHLREEVEAFLFRRCGALAPHAPLIIVVDEVSKGTEFSREVYKQDRKRPDAAATFRSECCCLADLVNGRALVISLDDDLPQAETTASGRSAIEAARLPLYPVTKLLEDVLRDLSENQDMHLNFEGKLVIASDDGGLSRISDRAASFAAIVGADVRFASYLREQLVAAKCGDQLSLLLESACNATGMSCSKIWSQPDGELSGQWGDVGRGSS